MNTQVSKAVQIEELLELYIRQSLSRPNPRKMYRLTAGGERIYYYLNDQGEPVFKESVSSVIRKNTPTSPFLMKWYGDMGTEAAEDYKDERAAFGTFMHKEIESYILNGEYDLDRLEESLRAYLEIERLNPGFEQKWAYEMKRNLLSFAAWYRDHEVEPLAVEISLASDIWNVAGMMDLPCELTITESGYWGEVYKSGPNKGQPKETKKGTRIRAIVDFKSGKSFYDDHALQLELYRLIWNENYPDLPITRIFNWAPSDWINEPGYKFKEQTDHPQLEKIPMILAMNEIDQRKKSGQKKILSGTIRKGEDPAANVQFVSYTDLVKAKHNEDKDPQD